MVSSDGGYRVADSVPNVEIDSLTAGTNILLLGPQKPDMRSVAANIITIAPTDDEGAVWIALDGEISWLIEEFNALSAIDHLSVIQAGNHEPIEDFAPEHYYGVKSPDRLTDLGMALIEYGDQTGSTFSGSRIVFDSVSTLLNHVEEQRVFEFITAFSGRIRVSNDLGIWLMNSQEHSPQTIATFRELFDIVIELPDEEESKRPRVEEDAGDTGDWVSKSAP